VADTTTEFDPNHDGEDEGVADLYVEFNFLRTLLIRGRFSRPFSPCFEDDPSVLVLLFLRQAYWRSRSSSASSTESLRSSLVNYPIENGRQYHAYKDGSRSRRS
jgi:hypothetical protein